MGEPKKGEYRDLLSYGLIVMTLTHTLTHAFQQMHTTLYPILKVEFALSNQQIGLISSIPSLAAAILTIPAGLATDRLGTKKVILFSSVIAAAGALTAGFAQNPWMFILAISLLYINTSFYHPASYSFTSFLFEPKDRSKALGIHGAGGTLGMALGPISISVLVGLFALGWRQVYLAWVVPLVISVFMVYFIKYIPTDDVVVKPSGSKPVSQAEKLFSTSLIMFLVYGALRTVAANMTVTFLNIWLVETRGLDVALASLVFGASNLMGIVAAPVGGVFAAKYGEKRWIAYTLAVAYASFALAFLVPGNWSFAAFYMGYGFFHLLGMGANSAISAKLSPSRQRGLGFALYFLPGSIVGAFAPLIAAYIADTFGVFNVFMVSVGVFALTWIMFQFGVKID